MALILTEVEDNDIDADAFIKRCLDLIPSHVVQDYHEQANEVFGNMLKGYQEFEKTSH
jgi:hypothetical protein